MGTLKQRLAKSLGVNRVGTLIQGTLLGATCLILGTLVVLGVLAGSDATTRLLGVVLMVLGLMYTALCVYRLRRRR